MGGETAVLPADVQTLQRLVVHLRRENTFLLSKASVLEDELRLLRHKIFGRRSERFSVADQLQSRLFDEAERVDEDQRSKQAEPTVEVAAHRRAKVESRDGAVSAKGKPVSISRSSNWTCGFAASSSRTGFTASVRTPG
jgi:hypothetical protein